MWDSAQSLATVAQQLSRVGAHALGRDYARAAVERDPQHPPTLYMSANLEIFFGETELATELLERCLALAPDIVDAHWLLSRLRQPGAAARIERIERALTRVKPGEDEAFLAYALHNELHDAREFKGAWAALTRACAAKRSQLNYDPAQAHALFAQLKGWTTTLIERILGGHSLISAAGETYEIPNQLRRESGLYSPTVVDERIVAARGRFDHAAIGRGYLAAMRWRARGRPFVTDKLPSNYLNIGFIAQALPHARFIHVVRDPIDTGLSNLRTLFTTACAYSYDQREFVDYHHGYRELMAHWHAVLPGRILDVSYEDVVADPAAAARRMTEFCALDFEPQMLDIASSTDPVATASSVLVRDGIRKDRGGLWQAYAEELASMRAGFAS